MSEKWHAFWQNSTAKFWLRSALYFVILLILIYLYSYSGINNSGFIYNEF
ncbi:teichoic acid D-Ala incorporation-associated protein DltX [Agrilactobacillus fermenti]|nr:teichoic acid D-Ala incorporation-associated protein DltX [Agrilactobacillus fermenti]MCD2256781.1 teichoic acid D-Ala incorporation-associated protein DltX [Agrilactobacillus fermenti]